jgi:hypothetical protein|tara:strand:+ start:214 stop:441 length:228 start_codon:yes stop_codon:yes gene_type:complete
MKDTEQEVKSTYLAKIEMVVRYTANEAPDEDHIITPITRFMRKTAKTYKGQVVDIMGRVVEEDNDFFDEDEEEFS